MLRYFRREEKPLASSPRRFQPRVEELEPRVVLYGTTGNSWSRPELITISFVPDGTDLGGVTSNLVATFNARFGSANAWQDQFRKAAQVWAQQTNINFKVITDSGAASGSGSYQQGDPNMGDIRIAGYDFNNGNIMAAADFSPSANNYSVAGDITFNTALAWNIGSDYDVYSVAMHEIGHALGLGHSAIAGAVMFSSYGGAKTGLASDDIAGIRNIYSSNAARAKDSYDASAANEGFATATGIPLTGARTALVQNRDITTTADIDFYKFTVPSGSTKTLRVTVQSAGLSLLAPKVWIYDSDHTLLATATATGLNGATLNLTARITAGSVYYIRVDGADATSFGTGKYAFTLNMGTGATPAIPLPNTTTANGSPLHSGGGLANQSLVGVLLDPLGLLKGLLGGYRGIFGGYGDVFTISGHDHADHDHAGHDHAGLGDPLSADGTSLFASSRAVGLFSFSQAEWDVALKQAGLGANHSASKIAAAQPPAVAAAIKHALAPLRASVARAKRIDAVDACFADLGDLGGFDFSK